MTGVNSVSVGDGSIGAVSSTSSGRAGASPAACRNAGSKIARDTDERRHGIAGQREDRLAACADPEPHRPARPLLDLVKNELRAELREHGRHEIELTHRYAAAQDEHVELSVEPIDRDCERVRVVAQPRSRHLTQAVLRQAGFDCAIVRRANLVGRDRLAGIDELVARRDHGDARQLRDECRRRGPRPRARRSPAAPSRVPARNTRLPAVRSLPRRWTNCSARTGASCAIVAVVPLRCDALDRHDGVDAAWQDGARHDLDALRRRSDGQRLGAGRLRA